MPEKHHYLEAKDIKDAIAKQGLKWFLIGAESQISCATLSAITVCHTKTNDIRVGIHHGLFIYFFVSLFLLTDAVKSIFLSFFSKEKNFSLQLNNYLSLFPPFNTIYVYSPTEVGDFTYFLKENSHHAHFLANVLNNLSDIRILHST